MAWHDVTWRSASNFRHAPSPGIAFTMLGQSSPLPLIAHGDRRGGVRGGRSRAFMAAFCRTRTAHNSTSPSATPAAVSRAARASRPAARAQPPCDRRRYAQWQASQYPRNTRARPLDLRAYLLGEQRRGRPPPLRPLGRALAALRGLERRGLGVSQSIGARRAISTGGGVTGGVGFFERRDMTSRDSDRRRCVDWRCVGRAPPERHERPRP